jgi:hypothetical protein
MCKANPGGNAACQMQVDIPSDVTPGVLIGTHILNQSGSNQCLWTKAITPTSCGVGTGVTLSSLRAEVKPLSLVPPFPRALRVFTAGNIPSIHDWTKTFGAPPDCLLFSGEVCTNTGDLAPGCYGGTNVTVTAIIVP